MSSWIRKCPASSCISTRQLQETSSANTPSRISCLNRLPTPFYNSFTAKLKRFSTLSLLHLKMFLLYFLIYRLFKVKRIRITIGKEDILYVFGRLEKSYGGWRFKRFFCVQVFLDYASKFFFLLSLFTEELILNSKENSYIFIIC